MSKKNTSIEFLNLLRTAEKEVADLYFHISQIAAASNPVLSELFSVLAKEEIVHMKYFDMLKDFQSETEDPFLETGDSLEAVTAELEEIRKKSEIIHSRGQAAIEREIIEAALAIENGLLEKHGVFAIRIADESLRKLFQSLKFADAEHVQKLQQYLAELDKK
jgi:rubrerythrin